MNLELVLYINLGLLTVVLLTLLVLVINYRKIEGYFTLLKFKIINSYIVSTNQKKDTFKFTIYNAALSDARLSSFGYSYMQKSIDFYQDYLLAMKLAPNHEEMIVSRGSFNFSVDINLVADMIQNINLGGFKVKPISLYAISSLGQMTRVKSAVVTKQLKRILKQRHAIEKKRLHLIKVEDRRLKKERFHQQVGLFVTMIKTKFNQSKNPSKKP